MRSVEKLKKFINDHNISAELIVLKESTKTSHMAANALGCSVAEIAKSIVILCNEPMVIVISGDKRVDLNKVSKLFSCQAKMADPDTAREVTGFPVGGVPPFGHDKPIKVLIDRSVERFKVVYAAGGSLNSIIKIPVDVLKQVTGGSIVDVSE
ncbi:MAG: YbaK/EbsC family protein [Thermoprotei archaeon]